MYGYDIGLHRDNGKENGNYYRRSRRGSRRRVVPKKRIGGESETQQQ